MRPLVSILIPTFNRERYLAEALDAALGQTYRHLEVLVSDNASTDLTYDVALQYVQRDPRVRVFRQATNVGPIRNYEFLYAQAQGEFVVLLGDDDLVFPHHVERLLAPLIQDPALNLAICRGKLIDSEGNDIPETEIPAHRQLFSEDTFVSSGRTLGNELLLASGLFIGGPPAYLFRRAALPHRLFGGITDEQLNFLIDFEQILILLSASGYFYTPEVLSVSRHHDGSISRQMRNQVRRGLEFFKLIGSAVQCGFLSRSIEQVAAYDSYYTKTASILASHPALLLERQAEDLVNTLDRARYFIARRNPPALPSLQEQAGVVAPHRVRTLQWTSLNVRQTLQTVHDWALAGTHEFLLLLRQGYELTEGDRQAILAPVALDETVAASGPLLYERGLPPQRTTLLPAITTIGKHHTLPFLSPDVVALSRAAFATVGGLELAAETVEQALLDWCVRASQSGFKCMLTEEASLRHDGEALAETLERLKHDLEPLALQRGLLAEPYNLTGILLAPTLVPRPLWGRTAPPAPLDEARGTRLLLLPHWDNLLADETLLRVYREAFTAADDVTLLLAAPIEEFPRLDALQALLHQAGFGDEASPDLLLVPYEGTPLALASVYTAAQALLVAPDAPEASQAIACGLRIPESLSVEGLRALIPTRSMS